MRLVLYAIPVIVTLYALIDAIMTPGLAARSLPKPLWIVVIVLIPFVGALGWLFFGRPRRGTYGDGRGGGGGGGGRRPGSPLPPGGPGRRRAPSAPDDDPAFLRSLDDAAWQERMRRRRAGDAPEEP